jgi:hypothetical protein
MAEPTTVEAATSVSRPFKSPMSPLPAKKMPPPNQKNAPQKPSRPGSFGVPIAHHCGRWARIPCGPISGGQATWVAAPPRCVVGGGVPQTRVCETTARPASALSTTGRTSREVVRHRDE